MTPTEAIAATPSGSATMEAETEETEQTSVPLPPDQRRSRGADLLQFVGTWQGDDLEECLDIVYATRSAWYP